MKAGWWCCHGSSSGPAWGEQPGEVRGEPRVKRAAASFSSESTSSYTWEKDSQDEASENQLLEDRLLQGDGLREESLYEWSRGRYRWSRDRGRSWW